MRTRGAFVLAVLCVLWSSGCAASDRAAADGVVFRDSAGIRIIENTTPAWSTGEAWSLAEAPELRIGVVDGDPRYQFFHMMGAWRFEDGRLVVMDGGTRELRFYDAAGSFLLTVGGRGEGPGEFGQLDLLDVVGDTLRIFDRALQRVSIFSPTGRFIRSFGIPKLEGNPMPEPRGWFADGTYLVETSVPFWQGEPQSGLQRIEARYYRLDPAGAVLDSLGEFVQGQHYLEADSRGIASVAVPFALRSATAIGGGRFYFGTSASYEIEARRPDGRLELLVRRLHENRPVTPADIDNYIRGRQRYAPGDANRRRLEALFRELPIPATMPAYASVMVDAAGNLWVEERPAPGASSSTQGSRWAVFDDEGRWLGTVTLPPSFEPFQIGADFILGQRVDELDVQYLELYRLVR